MTEELGLAISLSTTPINNPKQPCILRLDSTSEDIFEDDLTNGLLGTVVVQTHRLVGDGHLDGLGLTDVPDGSGRHHLLDGVSDDCDVSSFLDLHMTEVLHIEGLCIT